MPIMYHIQVTTEYTLKRISLERIQLACLFCSFCCFSLSLYCV